MSIERDRPTRTWRVLGLELQIGERDDLVRARACREIGLEPAGLRGFRLARKALDARRRHGSRRLVFVVHADLVVDAAFRSERLARALESGRAASVAEPESLAGHAVHPSLSRPVAARVAVVGAGPAGLLGALVLARHGIAVVLLDRGSAVETRSRELVSFHRTRVPNAESNLLFGEGGAGTYSDGKIYTRVDDPLEVPILEELVACGAQPEIVYDSRAHIGTDRLHRVLPAFRRRLVELGVECRWNTRVDGLVLAGQRVRALATSAGEVGCDAVLLAPGHSARDTWDVLHAQGVPFEAKPFQLGLRIEHPQALVDSAQHGTGEGARALGAASYALTSRSTVAAAHSFCMCPGGRIVASVNEAGYLCTNGMSNSSHSSRWANAALVATFGPDDFGPGPFAGVTFQRQIEARFFAAGGADYTAPAQRASDFLAGRASSRDMVSSYVLGLVPARLDELVPPRLRDALRHALVSFDRSIPGFAGDAGTFVGVESRSSGPVRIPRDPRTRRARGFDNLYPVGEGAGYAGGIMSAALDGARSALALLEHGVERTAARAVQQPGIE